MPYEPRTSEEVLQEMAGQVVSQSGALDDISEGGELVTLLGAFAEQVGGVEYRLKTIRDSFDLDKVFGSDLDERMSELPGSGPGGLPRIGASPASGSSLNFTRATTATSLVLPAGSVVGRTDDSSVLYTTVANETFGIGTATITGVRVVCQTTGTRGNAPIGTINKLISVPSDVISVIQTTAIGGGSDREDDEEFRNRGRAYLAGLGGSGSKEGLRAVALSYISSLGVRARYAYSYTDLLMPGHGQLVVDDGSGFSGLTQNGAVSTGTVPLNGTLALNHEGPATDFITKVKIGSTVLYYADPATNPTWVSYPERGLLVLKPGQTDISPGDTWTIGDADTPYLIYTGFIAELQEVISGNASSPITLSGTACEGTFVRVTAPTVYPINVSLNLILLPGILFEDARAATELVVQQYFLSLGPGDTLYLSDLYHKLESSLTDYIEAVEITSPTESFQLSDPRMALRAGIITVV